MPMLERTTAGLEPSGLRRLLPKVPKSGSKSTRTFHAALRCRNVSDAESIPACRSPHYGYFDMFTPEAAKTEPMNASALLLDFLYPKGALAFIHKLSSGGPDRRGSRAYPPRVLAHSYRKPTQQYSSFPYSSSAQESTKEMLDTSSSSTNPAAGSSFATASRTEDSSVPRLTQLSFVASSDSMQLSQTEQAKLLDELETVLRRDVQDRDSEDFDKAWSLYGLIEDGPRKVELVRALLLYMTPSKRNTESHRLLKLFGQLSSTQWDAASVAGAISANLNLKNEAGALSIFQRSTNTEAWSDDAPPGLGMLLAYALKTSSWHLISEVWSLYRAKTGLKKVDRSLLTAVTDLPHLQERLHTLYKYVDGYAAKIAEGPPKAWAIRSLESESLESDKTEVQDLETLKEVRKAVLEASLHHLDPEVTFPYVTALGNPRVYENFIRIAIDKKHTSLAARAFSKYRLVDGYRPHVTTLVNLVRDVYYPDNVRGMEDVLKDWHSMKGHLNRWGYQKYLAFYASRGDVTSVYRLWDEFTRVYPDSIQDGEDTFAHLLRVHAVRGDLTRVELAFFEIYDKYKVKPNTVCWNIRLHIYVERGHYSKAMKIFEDLCEAVEPDDYSFGTIMAIVGGRGDLALVSDLYWLAQQCGVKITEAIIDPIVEAYCQNDRPDEAERLCVVTTREGKVAGKPYTALWNTLLHHYALRHDLVAVNRILKLMTRLNVTYDDNTYSALLFALAQCRQPRRAVELLRAAQEDGIFRPTAHHYTLLMMAYIRSKQPHRAVQVNRLMHHMGFQRSSQQIQMVIKAFSQWQDFPAGDASEAGGMTSTERRDLFAKALREFQRSLTSPDKESSMSTRGQQTVGRDALRMHLGAVRRFSFVIFMLVQARDFAGVEEVLQLYKSIAPADERQQPLPLKLYNALMLSDYYEGRFDRVKEMWRAVLERAKEIGRPQTLEETRLESILGHVRGDTDTDIRRLISSEHLSQEEGQEREPSTTDGKVVAKLRYGLTDPLKTMQRLYASERDADGLVQLINEDILANGFLLDSKNWNHYVQNLARLGRVQEAFDVCETRLMGQWSGFAMLRARNRGPEFGKGGDEDAEGQASSSDDSNPFSSLSSSPAENSSSRGRVNGQASTGSTAVQYGSQSSYNTSGTKLSRAQQLRESATRFNRPMTYTLMVLAKAYLELEQMTVWSSVAERQFRDLSVKCPKSVHAVRTMVRMNSRIEGRVFGGGDGVGSDFGGMPLVGASHNAPRANMAGVSDEHPPRKQASW